MMIDNRRTIEEIDRELESCYEVKAKFDDKGISENWFGYQICLTQIRTLRWVKGEDLRDIAFDLDGIILDGNGDLGRISGW